MAKRKLRGNSKVSYQESSDDDDFVNEKQRKIRKTIPQQKQVYQEQNDDSDWFKETMESSDEENHSSCTQPLSVLTTEPVENDEDDGAMSKKHGTFC